MSIDLTTKSAVRQLRRAGKGPRIIARELGVPRETVRRVMSQSAVEALRCAGCGAMIALKSLPCLLCKIRGASVDK